MRLFGCLNKFQWDKSLLLSHATPQAAEQPQETSSRLLRAGFIAIQSIRLEKYGARKIKDREPLARV